MVSANDETIDNYRETIWACGRKCDILKDLKAYKNETESRLHSTLYLETTRKRYEEKEE